MAFTLNQVVPWGRTYDEYVAMFALSKTDLEKRVLDCSGGPASFNCVLTEQGGHVVSADPVYHFTTDEIRRRIGETYEEVMEQTGKNRNEFIWETITSVEELGRIRMGAMDDFLRDYQAGKREGRYIDAALPSLPFKDGEFDIALCSHFLFLYSEQLSEEFHYRAIMELCRVASEVRIFPLLELGANKSRHLELVLNRLAAKVFKISVEKVPYEFQKNGNEMLKISAV